MTANDWERHAKAIRRTFLTMHFQAKAGHVGSGLSAIDLLAYLHAGWLNSKTNDRFILSKGHAASALYATLHHFGSFSDADLATYYQDGTLLPAHPAPGAWKEIPAATGSLGHGLPIAAGMALTAKRWLKSSQKFVCLLSDGECDEGSVWEASLFASHHRLNNLTVVIDANGLQGFGTPDEVLRLEPLAAKLKAFGYEVYEIDGHSFPEIDRAFRVSSRNAISGSAPTAIVARTVKGKGVRSIEGKLASHYLPLETSEFEQALRELGEVG